MKPENLVHIREIFEEKTGVTLSTARPAVRPLRRAALTVAAVLCCLGVTALAANGLTNGALMQFFQSTDTFNVERTPVDTSAPLSHALEDTALTEKEQVNGVLMQFFQSGGAFGNEGTPEDVATPLSKEQLLTIDRHTTMIGQSQTVNGTTVTLHSVTAAATGHDILTYCTFSVEAPDGTWTEADNETLDIQEYGCLLFEGDAIRYGANGWLRVLDDPQGRPNVKTAVMAFIIHAHGDNSGVQLQVMLNNFRIFPFLRQSRHQYLTGKIDHCTNAVLQHGLTSFDAVRDLIHRLDVFNLIHTHPPIRLRKQERSYQRSSKTLMFFARHPKFYRQKS